jgi:sugar-specific transcriptional regulator TrmB
MDDISDQERAIELLQQLGLKEYEAKSFVALSRRSTGTAKEISEISDVPRTRVYDAIRVLESKGLVEVQHSNPQQFRAVSIDEAVETLRSEYEERMESLRKTLRGLEPVDSGDETDVTHEVWALSGDAGITTRAAQLIDDADREVILVVGHDEVFTEELAGRLRSARQRGVDVILGAGSEASRDRIRDALPDTEVFVSGLEWLSHADLDDDETEIGRLLLVDREAILVSSYTAAGDGRRHEQAVFGQGFDNGLVAIVRRLMATGLPTAGDPGVGPS